jgi:hypothetical protein
MREPHPYGRGSRAQKIPSALIACAQKIPSALIARVV